MLIYKAINSHHHYVSQRHQGSKLGEQLEKNPSIAQSNLAVKPRNYLALNLGIKSAVAKRRTA